MGKNTHFTSETNAQIVALHAVGHQTMKIMDLAGVTCTSVKKFSEESSKLKVAMILPHSSIGLDASKRLGSMQELKKVLISQQEK